MGFLRRILGRDTDSADDGSDEAPVPDERQGVTIWIRLGDKAFESEREQMAVFGLENQVIKALDLSGAGTFDTNDLVPGFFGMQLLGPDADRMLDAVRSVLTGANSGSYLAVRRGPAGTSEERVEI